MMFPKTNLITGILVLLGTHPFHEKHQSSWRAKVHLLGLFFCLLQLALTLYTFVLEHREEEFGSSNQNNILACSVMIKRLIALLLPIYTIVLKCCAFRSLEQFYEQLALFDVFLQSTEHRVGLEYACLEQELEQKVRKVNCFAGVLVVLVELFNIVTAFSYMIQVRGIVPSTNTLYFYHLGMSIFIATALNVYSKLYGVLLRHQLVNAFAEDIWEEGWQTESGQRRHRRRAMDKLIAEQKERH